MGAKSKANRRPSIGERQETNQAVAIYARVSTEDQEERGTIENQLAFLRRFVDLHGLPVAGEYIDDGISGAVPLGERPEGQRLLTDAEAGRFGAVMVYRIDRLGRSLRSLLDAHDRLQEHNVAIRSATEPFDTSSPIGAFLFQLLGSLAELERETIRERTSLGRNRVASDGKYTGGPIPLGYDLDTENRFIESQRIVDQLGVTEAQMVREIFARVASGQSTLNAEASRLAAMGVPNRQRYGPRNGKPAKTIEGTGHWRASTLQQIVHNPMYKGEGVIASYRGDVTLPAPPLVDAVIWQQAQEALLRNRRLSNNTKHTYLLRGLMRCANCGKSYTGTTSTYPRAGEMVSVRKYRCGGQVANHHGAGVTRCEAKTLHAVEIEAAVWEECRRFIHNPGEALDDARRKLRERKADSTRFETTRRDTLTTLAEKETERERILTMYRKGKIDEAEAETQLDAIAKEAGQLREDLESMRAQAALLDISEAHLTESAVLLGRLRDELETVEETNDLVRKREIIAAYVRQIRVETTRVGPRQLAADVTLRLRLKPEPVRIVNVTRSPGNRRWKRSVSSWPSGASTAASA